MSSLRRLILLIGVHFLHAVQVKRNAGSVKSQAESAEAAGKMEEARKLYKQYLTLAPDDDDAFSKLALVSAKVADDLEAFNRRDFAIARDDLNKAVVKDPDNLEVRRKLAEYSLRPFGKFAPTGFRASYSDAVAHITQILKTKPDDPELLVMLAECKAGSDRRQDAIAILQELVGYNPEKKTFDESKAKAPHYIEAYKSLADVLMKKPEDPEGANLVMNRLVEVNKDSKEAFYKRAVFTSMHQLPKATSNRLLIYDSIRGDLARALELDPDYAEALLMSAQITLRTATADDLAQSVAEARKTLQRGIEKFPQNELFHQNLAATYLSEAAFFASDLTKTKDPTGELRKAKLAEALARVNEGLAKSPHSYGLLRLKVAVQLERGDLKDVRNVLEQMRRGSAPRSCQLLRGPGTHPRRKMGGGCQAAGTRTPAITARDGFQRRCHPATSRLLSRPVLRTTQATRPPTRGLQASPAERPDQYAGTCGRGLSIRGHRPARRCAHGVAAISRGT